MTASGFGAVDRVAKTGDSMSGSLTLGGSPPVIVPGATAGQALISDGSGHFTPGTVPGTGTQFLSAPAGTALGGSAGTITATTISSAIAAGYNGIFLDPRYVWSMSGLVVRGVSNFVIESRMTGSIGWTGAISYNTNGYVQTGSGADGIQVYADSGAETQGVQFRGLALAGSNTNAVIHFGGRQRRTGMVDCFVYNTRSAAGAYGVIVDASLGSSPVNSEDNYVTRCNIAGAYAAIGLGIADVTQHANDMLWSDITTAGGTYSVVCAAGSNHQFHNYYDRSNPTTAVVWNNGGILHFIGGEDQNSNAGGVCHLIDNSSATTIIVSRTVTQVTNPTTITLSAGTLVSRSRNRWGGTVAISGGTLDLSDPAGSYSGLTVSGSAGTLMQANNYNPGTAPITSGFSGTTMFQWPAVVASKFASAQTGTNSITWTPPASNTLIRVDVHIHPTVAGTSTVPTVSYVPNGNGGVAVTPVVPMWQLNSAATAPSYTCNATGEWVGSVTMRTDASATAITVTVTPTGSTYRYAIEITRLA